MEKFQTFYGLQLSVLVFNVAETLSTGIQGKQTSSQDAFTAAETAILCFPGNHPTTPPPSL